MGKHYVKDWDALLQEAATIARGYGAITLRQLFYQLVSRGLLLNRQTAYSTLGQRTARARREGWFPALVDRTRGIEEPATSENPREALEELSADYRRDRTEGQGYNVYIGVEKDALAGLLWEWFAQYGTPLLTLKGYSSQSFCDEVSWHISKDDRPSVLLYGGDYDPSGLDIQRDFNERVGSFDEVVRVALTWEQVEEHNLPPAMGKATDPRSGRFAAMHGGLVQVELDALPPDTLRAVYQTNLDEYFDYEQWEQVKEQEAEEAEALSRVLDLYDEMIADERGSGR